MKRSLATVATTLGLVLALTSIPSPASATGWTSGTAELRGIVQSLALPSLTVHVTSVSTDLLGAALRVYRDRDLAILTDTATSVTRDGKTAATTALRITDIVTARVRCTFTASGNSTTANCLATRITAATAPAPKPVQLVITGTVTARDIAGFALTPAKVESESRGRSVGEAIKALPSVAIAVDTKTVLRLGDAYIPYASLATSATVRAHVTCQPAVPYNCLANRIDILAPKPEKVVMVGKLTLITASSIGMNATSVVPQEDDAVDVQVLHDQVLSVAIDKSTPIRRAGKSVPLSSLTAGTQVTVRAQCQLVAPFACAATRVTAKA